MNFKAKGSISDNSVEEDKYKHVIRERQKHVDEVLRSCSKKRIVVAGPGTGKTYLFKMILEGKKDTLTLSFVNALVEELSLELCGLSDVKTLHSFALSVLKEAKQENIKIFPELTKVIEQDARTLLKEEIDFDHLFHNKVDKKKHIEFYKKRKDYYKHYGFTDIVFAVVRYFEKNKQKIPMYTQVVVDEFQDFNILQVSLIDLLAEKSPVLLAGDDDQALYESLKSASPKHIRQRHGNKAYGYEVFKLPYCSRSTRVIIEATNDIIRGATQDGHLLSRISKPFRYFANKEKDQHSEENPHIIYKQLQARQIPFFIQNNIKKIAEQVRKKFTVLIISPTNTQCKTIVNALKKKGFENIQFVQKKDRKEPTLLDGLKLLLIDKKCNLGWRIVAQNLLKDTDFENILKNTNNVEVKRFSDLIGKKQKQKVTQMLKTLRAVRDGKQTEDKKKLEELLKIVGVDAYQMATDYLKDEIKSCKPTLPTPTLSNPGIRKIPITTTTIQRSKGLDADYVFITYFDDQYFIKDKSKVSDQEICNFLVALTRARSKVFLISSHTRKKPVFLKWIDKKRILGN